MKLQNKETAKSMRLKRLLNDEGNRPGITAESLAGLAGLFKWTGDRGQARDGRERFPAFR